MNNMKKIEQIFDKIDDLQNSIDALKKVIPYKVRKQANNLLDEVYSEITTINPEKI